MQVPGGFPTPSQECCSPFRSTAPCVYWFRDGLRRRINVDVNVAHVTMGVAMAGMLVPALTTLPTGLWEVFFVGLAAWFLRKSVQFVALHLRRGEERDLHHVSHYLTHLVMSCAMLYMYLAAPASGAAGSGAMSMGAASGATANFVGLPLFFLIVLCLSAVWHIDSLNPSSSHEPAFAGASVPSQAMGGGDGAKAPGQIMLAGPLAPRATVGTPGASDSTTAPSWPLDSKWHVISPCASRWATCSSSCFEQGSGNHTTRRLVVGSLAISMAVAACGSTTSSTLAGVRSPLPAGTTPSRISKMVCSPKARSEIADALGVTAIVKTPTWSGHLYSCHYAYPNGTFTLSVKELSSWSQTLGYFRGLGTSLGDASTLPNLGQGGFLHSRRISGGSEGLEGPPGGHLETSRPVRQAAHALRERRHHRCRCDSRMLVGGLTASEFSVVPHGKKDGCDRVEHGKRPHGDTDEAGSPAHGPVRPTRRPLPVRPSLSISIVSPARSKATRFCFHVNRASSWCSTKSSIPKDVPTT